MLNLANRNLRIFFRQKSAVFFSLLGVIIVMGLYLLFLGDAYVGNSTLPDMKSLMDHWLIAGIVSITSITTTMGAFEIMVIDRANKYSKDFFAAPLDRKTIVGGYVLAAFMVGLIMTFSSFLLGELYILMQGGSFLSLSALLQMLAVILLSTFMSSSFVFFLVSFFSSISAFSTASTVLGTLAGFLTGIYVPIGSLPEVAQYVIKIFPIGHAGALMRQIMMKDPSAITFAGLPPEALHGFEEFVGVVYLFGQQRSTPLLHLSIILGSGILFFLLAVWNVRRQHQ